MTKLKLKLQRQGWRDRDIEVLLMIHQGLSDKIMAERIGITVAGVKFRKANIYRRLKLRGYGKQRPVYAVMIWLNNLVNEND